MGIRQLEKENELDATRVGTSIWYYGLILYFSVVLPGETWLQFSKGLDSIHLIDSTELHFIVSHEETDILLPQLEQAFMCLKETVLLKISLLFKILISIIRVEHLIPDFSVFFFFLIQRSAWIFTFRNIPGSCSHIP